MTSYHDLDDATYKWIRARPFTRIHEKPTWDQMERLHEEAADVAMGCDMSYTWSSGHGILAEILGPVKYLAETTFVYVEPTKPPHQHAGIAANTTRYQTRVLTAANDLLQHEWAIVAGFRKGTSKNIRDALEDRYVDQLKQQIFRYK